MTPLVLHYAAWTNDLNIRTISLVVLEEDISVNI